MGVFLVLFLMKWNYIHKKPGGKNSANGGPGDKGMPENAHIFQEYTYKKITPCDICSQILRGHTRQGLKCKLCRMNVHPDCQIDAGKCTPKSRLLRRQKSASELDSRVLPGTEDDSRYSTESDLIYQQQQQQINLNTNDRRANFGGVKSMSMDSQGSGNSQGSTSALGHGG